MERISFGALAEKVDSTAGTLCRIENDKGTNNPSFLLIARIAQVLGMPLQQFRKEGEIMVNEFRRFEVNSAETYDVLTRWANAGSSIGVWCNEDLGHPQLGHLIFCRVGPGCTYEKPEDMPQTMPDNCSPTGIGWRYQKAAVVTPDQFDKQLTLELPTLESEDL